LKKTFGFILAGSLLIGAQAPAFAASANEVTPLGDYTPQVITQSTLVTSGLAGDAKVWKFLDRQKRTIA